MFVPVRGLANAVRWHERSERWRHGWVLEVRSLHIKESSRDLHAQMNRPDDQPHTSPSLIKLISLLRDGELGFRHLADRVEDQNCRQFLLEESGLRSAYANELERASSTLKAEATSTQGTRLGAMHREWVALKATLGVGDSALLGATELCEWFAVNRYLEAQNDTNLSIELHDLIARQNVGIHQSRQIVQEFRRELNK